MFHLIRIESDQVLLYKVRESLENFVYSRIKHLEINTQKSKSNLIAVKDNYLSGIRLKANAPAGTVRGCSLQTLSSEG